MLVSISKNAFVCLITCDLAVIDIPHPGKCPSVPSSAVGICHSECRHDAQCPNDKKCCSNGCGTSCKKPVPQTGNAYHQGSYMFEILFSGLFLKFIMTNC